MTQEKTDSPFIALLGFIILALIGWGLYSLIASFQIPNLMSAIGLFIVLIFISAGFYMFNLLMLGFSSDSLNDSSILKPTFIMLFILAFLMIVSSLIPPFLLLKNNDIAIVIKSVVIGVGVCGVWDLITWIILFIRLSKHKS